MQTPPNFDSMLHSRTGMHAYGDNYTHESNASHFQAPFTGLNNAYGPGTYGAMSNMVPDQEAQTPRIFLQTADQLQMQAQRGGFEGSGDGFEGYGASTGDQDGCAQYGGPATPARKASKKAGGHKNKGGENSVPTPLSKKSKRTGQDTAKGNLKRNDGRKQRKDSVMQVDDAVVDNLQQQQALPFNEDFYTHANHDNFGNIPIANDTGCGIGGNFGGQINGNVPNFSFPFITPGPQQVKPLTSSPADMNGGFTTGGFVAGLPARHNSGNIGNTGITPAFNSFGFDTGSNFTMPSNNSLDNSDYGAFGGSSNGMNSSFSSSGSGEVSTNGSQSDQAATMSFNAGAGADGTAGVGLGMDMGTDVNSGPWMPQMGGELDADIDMGLGGAGDDNDNFISSLLAQDLFQ